MNIDKISIFGLQSCFDLILKNSNLKEELLKQFENHYVISEEWDVIQKNYKWNYVKVESGDLLLEFQQPSFLDILSLTNHPKYLFDLFVKQKNKSTDILTLLFLRIFGFVFFFTLILYPLFLFFFFNLVPLEVHFSIIAFLSFVFCLNIYYNLGIVNFNNKALIIQSEIEILCRNWILLLRHMRSRELSGINAKFKMELPIFLNIYKYTGAFANGNIINTDIKDLCTDLNFNFDELVIAHIMRSS